MGCRKQMCDKFTEGMCAEGGAETMGGGTDLSNFGNEWHL